MNENTAKYVLKIADILRFGKNKIEKDYTSAYKYYKKIYNNPNSKTWLTDSYFNLTAYDSAKTNMYEICVDNKLIDPKKIKDIDESMSKCDIEISEKL